MLCLVPVSAAFLAESVSGGCWGVGNLSPRCWQVSFGEGGGIARGIILKGVGDDDALGGLW